MAKKSLTNYIKELIQKGYDAYAIKGVLLKYGYTNNEIDDAISLIYRPTIRHEIHLSHTTVFVIIFIFVSLLGASFFYFYYTAPKAQEKLLDLNLEPLATTAAAGESVTFIKELSNLGSSKRYDVVIKEEIIDLKTNKVITQKIETRAIETFGSTQTRILVPKETKEGNYVLRAIVEYGDKKAVATLPIKVTSAKKGEAESCFDGINNQNEEGIDCGGICRPCEEKITECSDNNQCTEDAVENGACAYKPIAPCCGNDICEEQEICAADCKKTYDYSISTVNLDEIKELAKSDPGKALKQCNAVEVPDIKDTCISSIGEVQRNKNYCNQIGNARIKDLCFSNIAKSVNDNSLCEEISAESRKDSCYMTFVLDNKDYSVCGKVTNKHLRQSCESLKQLSEINQQQSQQTGQ